MNYFKVTLKDGSVLDFDKKCDTIKYTDDKYLILKHKIDNEHTLLLAMINHDEVSMVLTEEELCVTEV